MGAHGSVGVVMGVGMWQTLLVKELFSMRLLTGSRNRLPWYISHAVLSADIKGLSRARVTSRLKPDVTALVWTVYSAMGRK